MFDQHGLHLIVQPSGFKGWRLKYRFGGKEKVLTFGAYPDVSLKEARDLMHAARGKLAQGIDPSAKGGQTSDGLTFRQASQKWLALQQEGWKPKHYKTVHGRIESDLLPVIGTRPITTLKPRELADILADVQARGAIEVAHRLRSYMSSIFEYAIAMELMETNPAASLSVTMKPVVKKRFPALRTMREVQMFAQAFEAEPNQPSTRLASRLLALTAARPGNIRWAQREEFEDFAGEEPIWRIPAEKMKLELAESEQEAFEFIIPLSRQAVELVNAAIEQAGRRRYLFPSMSHAHKPISENALSDAYRRMPAYSGRHVPHGWRTSFSTIMNERASELDRPADRAIIDLMLAHKPRGVEADYNRAAYMGRRRQIAQEWADMLLDGMRPASELVVGRRKR